MNSQFTKRFYPYILVLGIIFVIHIYFVLFNESILIFYGDSYQQQLYFYLGGWERFHQGDFSFWNWSIGLGANQFSNTFYYLTSPFFYLTLLLKKEWIPHAFLYLNALKLFLLFCTSYLWLGQVSKIKESRTIGALIIVFSGWVSFLYHYNHFLDGFILYPLVLYSIDRLLDKNKPNLLILSLISLGFINYYLFYMFVPFALLYYVLKGLFVYKMKYRDFIRHLSITFVYVLLSTGVVASVLIPSFAIVLSSSRIGIGEEFNLLSTISKYDVYRYFSTMFIPVMNRFDPTSFISTQFDNGIGWSGGISIYSFLISPILLPYLIFLRNKQQKTFILTFFGIILSMASFLVFYKLFQGSLDVRWFYMFIFINAYGVTLILDEIELVFHKPWIGAGLTLISIFSLLAYTLYKRLYVTPENLNQLIIWAIASCIIIASYLFSFKFRVNQKFLMILVSLEALISFPIVIYTDQPIKSSNLTENWLKQQDVVNHIKENDDDFYRMIFDTDDMSSQNEPQALNYAGLSFYQSVYNFEQEAYLNRFKSTWSMPVNFGRYNSYLTLAVKYYVTKDYNHPVPFGFEFADTYLDYLIYENKYFLPIGFLQNQTLSTESFRNLSYINQDRILLNHIVFDSSENTNIEYLNELTRLVEWGSPTKYDFEQAAIPENSIIYVENFDIPVVKINQINVEKVNEYYYWQFNYLAYHVVNNNNDSIQLEFDNVYASPTNINVYLDKDLSYYDTWYKSMKNSTLQNTRVHNSKIQGHISVEKTSYLYTSIPYDSGWVLKINGENQEYEKVNLGFIGFKLEKGNYEIELNYIPQGLVIGSTISIISILLLLLLKIRSINLYDV